MSLLRLACRVFHRPQIFKRVATYNVFPLSWTASVSTLPNRQHEKNTQRTVRLSLFGLTALAASLNDLTPRRRKSNGGGKDHLLFDSVRRNALSEVKQLVTSGDVDINCRHELGWTPIHLAVVSGNFEMVKLLLELGADVNCGDAFTNIYDKAQELGTSSLEIMFWRDSDFSDRYRLNTNRTTFRGCTPLHYAVSTSNFQMVQLLLDKGADPTIENDMGYRGSDYALDDNLHSYLLRFEETFEAKKAEIDEANRLKYPLEKRLRDNLVGQEAAIRTVSATIRRWQSGWVDDEHPLVMMFLGSSGIGKTELAKQVANHLSSKKKSSQGKEGFLRLDMSEYQERHSVARLIGSPPGYVGHEEGGQLTTKLAESPNAVVLFDEACFIYI